MATVPTCEELLLRLIKQREYLMQKITSGVQEVEQPMLGRTTYRSLDEMQAALSILNGQIAELMAKCGGDATAAWKRTRRPIYPVVQEI